MEWWDVHFSQFLHIILLELHYKEQRVWLWACPHTKENCILTTSKLLWIWMSPVFLESVLFPTASKNCIFKLLAMKLTKWSFYSTVLLQLCMCNCVNCTQWDFISMTKYTEVLLKHKRDALLRNLLQGSSISPHNDWGFIFPVWLP